MSIDNSISQLPNHLNGLLINLIIPQTFRGRKATRTTEVRAGRQAERRVFDVLQTQMGLQMIPMNLMASQKIAKLRGVSKEDRKLLRNYSFNTLPAAARASFTGVVINAPYIKPVTQRKGRTEFVLYQNGVATVRIEVKHQDVNGSVDDKWETLVSRLQNNDYPEPRFVLVGTGAIYTEEIKQGIALLMQDRAPHKETYVIDVEGLKSLRLLAA